MQTEQAKQRLEEEKIRLEKEMNSVGQKNEAEKNDWEAVPTVTGAQSDLVDQADVVISNEDNAAILADLEARYDVVIAALERIAEGTYGVCQICKGDIEDQRIAADPAAGTCIEHL